MSRQTRTHRLRRHDLFIIASPEKDNFRLQKNSGEFSFGAFECPANILVTARSHFLDRFVPDCEIVNLPPKKAGGGNLTYEKKELLAKPVEKSRQLFAGLKPKLETQVIQGKIFFDFRIRTPQNWAHFLNNHLPIFFAIAEDAGLDPTDALLVLPANTPEYIRRAAEVFGLETLCTDAPVQGAAIGFESTPWTGIRSIRAEWAQLPLAQGALDAAGIRDGNASNLPERAFISRRDTRNLENEDEVEAFLKRHGYTKVYPEDMSVIDQFKLFEHAQSIVSIHGAAIAPLLYRSPNSRLTNLIELFPCGHMTDVYRVMSNQVGCDWIGVRGKIKPEHVAPAYDLNNPFLKYSLQSFELDIESLKLAMKMI